MAKFDKIIGTGGLGTGIVYRLKGNHDLGRNESRAATLLDQKDFCKLHIIFHYVAKLLKELNYPAQILPVGAVGEDDPGRRVLGLMAEVGMNTKYIRVLPDWPTLFGVCYTFPDGSGGNLGGINSACGQVTPAMIAEMAHEMDHSLVLAAPEVPMASRKKLLQLATEQGCFTAASFVSEELASKSTQKLLRFVDLLAINIDEALALSGLSMENSFIEIVKACVQKILTVKKSPKILITNGKQGAYAYEEGILQYLPALRVKAANTAGAGDAALAGLLIGVALDLPFLGKDGLSCFRLSRLLAAMSVTWPDTIHFGINLASLKAFAKEHDSELSL